MIAIPLLAELLIVLVAIALAAGVKYFAQMIGHAVGSGGWVGSIVNFLTGGIVTRAENAISHWAGRAVQGIDATIGTAFHALALTVDRIGATLELVGTFSVEIAHAVGSAVSLGHLATIVRDIRHEIHAVSAAADHAIAQALANAKGLAKDLVHPLLKRLQALEHTVHHVLDRRVAHALHLAEQAEADAQTAITQIAGAITPADVVAFAGAVAYSLTTLGVGQLTCNSAQNLMKNRQCGLWGGLDDLLNLLFDAVLFVDLCSIIPEVTTLFGEFEQPLTELISSAANAACAHPPSSFESVPALSLALPPNPGFSLSLP